jgi:cell division protein FtsN
MAQDYKYQGRHRHRASPPWVWATVGLLVGLFVAFLVFLQLRAPAPESPALALETPPERQTRTTPIEKVIATAAVEPKAEPAPPPKPRFDFYNLLPEMEVVVPEQELQGARSPEGVREVQQPGTYLLQAGSFRSQDQADQLRARLALLGVETTVQTVKVNTRETWHRVRVGPFSNLEELNEARSMLKTNGIDAILIRLTG